MRLSCLAVVVLLVVSSSVFAQHSSAGSSSSSSGGGSHGGSVGSSSGSYSSSAHSSGASAPHGSGAQLAHSTLLAHSTPSGLNIRQAALKPNATATGTQAEKRGFFSHLRHPFLKPRPMLETSLRLPVCKKEPCTLPICPRGQSLNGNGVCAATNLGALSCQTGNYSGAGACYPDDCQGLALALNRLALIPDEEARKAKGQILQEYAWCRQLRSIFPPYWAANSSLNFLADLR